MRKFKNFSAFLSHIEAKWVMDFSIKMAVQGKELVTWSPWHLEVDIFEKKWGTFQWRDPNPHVTRPKILSTSSGDSGDKVRRKWGDFAQRPHSL